MRIVFVASEAAPFVKTGGLGDVVGGLPIALANLGHHVTVVTPYYREHVLKSAKAETLIESLELPDQAKPLVSRVLEIPAESSGVRFLFVDQPELYGRRGIYVDEKGRDFHDNCKRFSALCHAALLLAERLQLRVDCFHVHDWHSALLAVLLKTVYRNRAQFRKTGCVLTLHNLAYQGVFDWESWPATGLDDALRNRRWLGLYGKFSLLKGGIIFADSLTTVSPTYAREIQGKRLGFGLERWLRRRRDRLVGIVNGIDARAWNPASDRALPVRFDRSSWRSGKLACKRKLRRSVGLSDSDMPLLGFVGRLVEQKGVSLIARALDALLGMELQLVMLGTGDLHWERWFSRIARRHRRQIAVRVAFDDAFARLVFAAADMFLMPSEFEPCGLAQLYCMRYGAIPIVRKVGGLADTVFETQVDGGPTGFVFQRNRAEGLVAAVRRAMRAFHRPQVWSQLVENAMAADWTWEGSAARYVAAYRTARHLRRGEWNWPSKGDS